MTSKRLFLRCMKEDMRHKVWMLALSVLGNFLSMPVLWLLYCSDVGDRMAVAAAPSEELLAATTESINRMTGFFRQQLMISAGVIAVAGAVIVGLECFRYLQQRPMVDTYHSLPIGRVRLFWVKYVNGFLIWLVPYLLCMLLTLFISAVWLGHMGGLQGIPALIREAGIDTAVLIVVFLLVYHLLLLATMLTGNLLNTLAAAAIIGGGAVSAYGTGLGFMISYFRTYYLQGRGLLKAVYVSPLAAPVYLLGARMEDDMQIVPTLVCLLLAIALGALALLAYCRRPSERAGKGVDMKRTAAVMRLFVSVLGGMGGWLFMDSLVGSRAVIVWEIFGALLVGILVYGVLDVMFSMDFKAFFRHRWGMGASVILTLLICFGFQEDWLGYDRYLPQQERIRAVSVACSAYSNVRSAGEIMSGMELTDTAQIYAFLERGVENGQGHFYRTEEALAAEDGWDETLYRTEYFQVRVTLTDGRSYYREYPYHRWDADVVLPLLCSPEYIEKAYCLSEDRIEDCFRMRFVCGSNNSGKTVEVEIEDRAVLREIATAYDRDLSERPEAAVLEEGQVLGRIIVWTQDAYDPYNYRSADLYILESMTHTLEAMERNGIRIFHPFTESADIERITLTVNIPPQMRDGTPDQAERCIRNQFGVFPESWSGTSGAESSRGGTDPGPVTQVSAEYADPWVCSLVIDETEEIGELLPLIQYYRGRSRLFGDDFVSGAAILDSDGTEWEVWLRRGALPEKYIRRFLEEVQGK